MLDNSTRRIVRFGTFEVDLGTGELRRQGKRLRLQEQPFQILVALLERPGELVTREQLQRKLWPEDTFVDFDHSLNAAIKRLREALGESADAPVFIETLARRGYRFIGTIWMPTAPPAERPAWWRVFVRRKALFLEVMLCLLVPPFVYYGYSLRSRAGQPVLRPAVSDAGEKHTPSLSPDGQHLAFAWNGGTGRHFNLYVKLLGTEKSIRLTNQESIDFNPVWSPDGRYIAFCRIQKGATGIYMIPALGGVERKVRETHWLEEDFTQVFWSFGRLSWSPDGKLLAYSDRINGYADASSVIFLLSVHSQELRRLTSPVGLAVDYNPAFSPDGEALAFNRSSQSTTSIYTVPVSGGKEQRLVSGVQYGWGLAWTADGRNIVFARAGWLADAGWLWKIPRGGGEPERLQFGQEGVEPSIRGNRLVYARQVANINIWRRDLHPGARPGPSEKFIQSTRMESGPQFSPDGSRIAFESTRSGDYEIWMCRSDGTALVQLTSYRSMTGTPRWSPDGQNIAFDSRATGNADIFVVDSAGGSPRRLTTEQSGEVVPSWSRDGHWIYFASDRTGRQEVWKMSSTGGPAVQLTHHGGFAAFESSDGRFLYYAKGMSAPGLWRIPAGGGEEEEVIGSLMAGYWGYWAVAEDGIYFLDSAGKPGIAFFHFKTGRTTRLFDLENRPATQAPGLAVSASGTVLYTQLDAVSRDLLVVENFR